MKQMQENLKIGENAGLSIRKLKKTFQEMFNAIRKSLRNLACLYNKEVTEDDEDDIEHFELRKLSDDDEPGWVMGTISRTDQN
jgi:hypothetical protein